jgi:hypothetical protein
MSRGHFVGINRHRVMLADHARNEAWFDADLGADVQLSTRPGTDTHWGQLAFPLPRTRVASSARVGFEVQLTMSASLGWRWVWRGTIDQPGCATVPFLRDTSRRFVGGIDRQVDD